MEIKLYEDTGFVRLVDHYGTDQRIVDAARVSYADGTKKVRNDEGLIDYLMRHRHTSPFEMVDFTFHIKTPIYVMRQMIRHRTHSVNEISARYSVIKDEFYLPERLRLQSTTNKQGGAEDAPDSLNDKYQRCVENQLDDTYDLYEEMIEDGISRELARSVLPVSTMTEYYWKQNLHNIFHFLKLRKDEHAQKEIRDLAFAMSDIVKTIVPAAYSSWENHVENSISFSADELSILKNYLNNKTLEYSEKWSAGRIKEFENKLEKSGLKI